MLRVIFFVLGITSQSYAQIIHGMRGATVDDVKPFEMPKLQYQPRYEQQPQKSVNPNPIYFKVTNCNNCNVDSKNINNVLAFYYNDNNEYSFANMVRKRNSQSYGVILDFKQMAFLTDEGEEIGTKYNFTWKYSNSYDDKEGLAMVSFVLFDDNKAFFTSIIDITLDGDRTIEYWGYKE